MKSVFKELAEEENSNEASSSSSNTSVASKIGLGIERERQGRRWPSSIASSRRSSSSTTKESHSASATTSSSMIKAKSQPRYIRIRRSYRPVDYKTPRPTIVAKKNWKVTRDAQVLDQALDDKGILKAEKTIVEILCSCNAAQRMELKKVFKSQTKENLLQVLREELTNGNFLDLTLVMLREPLAFDIDMINVFIEDENRWPALIGLLIQKSKKELQMIEEKYENLFHQSIEKKIRNEVFGNYADILFVLLKSQDETDEDSDIRLAANVLMKTAEDPKAFQKAVLETIAEESFVGIREICEAVRQMYQVELIDVVDDIFGPDDQAFKAAIAACDDTAFFMAGCLNDALESQDDEALMRILVARSEIDLKDISEAYQESFEEKLAIEIEKLAEDDESYQNMLLGILQKDNVQNKN